MFESLLSLCTRQAFSVAYLVGDSRSGKTHFSIMLAAALAARQLYPRIVEGQKFAAFLSEQEQISTEQDRYRYVIVDDAERYFLDIIPGLSGPFVNYVERLRKEQGSLIFLSSSEINRLPCDEHVVSRLMPGNGFRIDPPGTDDLRELVQIMAKQRGLSLSSRKVQFLVVRLGRSVAAIEDYLDRLTHLSSTLGASIKFPLLSDAI
jgi:chromosomal replication initiation ATPase DnaA